MPTTTILDDLIAEIARAEEKFGRQYSVPDVDQDLLNRIAGCSPMHMANLYGIPSSARARAATDGAFRRGTGTWAHILVEEVAEAVEAAVVGAPHADLRTELIEVAAVALRWVDAIDERGEQ